MASMCAIALSYGHDEIAQGALTMNAAVAGILPRTGIFLPRAGSGICSACLG